MFFWKIFIYMLSIYKHIIFPSVPSGFFIFYDLTGWEADFLPNKDLELMPSILRKPSMI